MKDFRPLPPTFLTSEASESVEGPKFLFFARLGFDFIKDQQGKYSCVEVNGQYAGVRIDRADPQLVTEEEKQAVRELNETPVVNPRWLEAITDDKAAQKEILGEYAPEQVNEGSFAHLMNERGGEIVIKKRRSGGGNDVFVFNRSSLEEARRKAEAGDVKFSFLKDIPEDVLPKDSPYVVQKYLRAVGAEFAEEDIKGNPAAMRFLVDVMVFDDGTFVFKDMAGFQRVSRYRYDQAGKEQVARVINNEIVDLTRVGVVNSVTGARTVPLSQIEFESGLTIARELTQRIIDIGRTKSTYQSDAVDSRQSTEQAQLAEAKRKAADAERRQKSAEERALVKKWDEDGRLSGQLQRNISQRYKRRISLMPGHVMVGEFTSASLPTGKFMQALDKQLKSLEKDDRGRSLLTGLMAGMRYPYIHQSAVLSDEDLGTVGEIKFSLRGNQVSIPICLDSEQELRNALDKFSREKAFFEPIFGWRARRLLPPKE